jgi:hypothetical protein
MPKTPPNGGKPWTAAQVSQLTKEASQNTPTRVIALHLGRTPDAVQTKASDAKVSLKPNNQSPRGGADSIKRKKYGPMGVAGWSLIIAVLALVVATTTGVAQIVLWQREGPKVKLTTTFGIPVPEGDPLVCINAANSGRHPTTIEGWGFEIDGLSGSSIVDTRGGYMCATVPHRLEAHSSVDFRTELVPALRSVLQASGGRRLALIPFVTLPTGRVRGAEWMPHNDWWTKAAQG